MYLFQRPAYQSDITLFLKQFKADHPQAEQHQKEGRDLLWDKTVDREAMSEFRAARVAQQPYVYQSHGK